MILASFLTLFHSIWQTLGPSMSLQMTQFHSFYGSNIPLYICTHVLICSSLEEHFNCFHVLTIVSSAAVKIRVQSAWVFWPLGFSGYSFHSYPLPSLHGFLRIGVVDVNDPGKLLGSMPWPKAAPGLYAWSHWGGSGLDLGPALILWQQHPTALGELFHSQEGHLSKLYEEGAVEPCSGHITSPPLWTKKKGN